MEGMTLEKLQVVIEAQTKAYNESLRKAQAQTKATTSAIEKQTSKIKGAFSSLGKKVGLVLSAAVIAGFGKSCIKLASDLQEVQNVVDVTFGSMSEKINKFARDALESFGLSETSAKRYTSTMGAMLKSMGLTTEQAADMSMKMAGLSADMASFYNLDTDDAFAKIRSGISGETEPLKQLGINMSVANLEAYALSQGMNKAYNAMTQQEQAVLRYNYLLKATADAQGDFARTSDSWANQVRILVERFNSLKAVIGRGLIAVLTPVIRALNQLLAHILTVADAFSNLIAKFTGKSNRTETTVKGIGGAADIAGSSMAGVSDATDSAEKSMAGLGGATDKAKKSAKDAAKEFGGLASFDEVHTLSKGGGAGGSGGGAGGSGVGAGTITENLVDAANETAEVSPVLDKIIKKVKELQNLFKEGFKAGLGDVNLDGIKKAVEGIKESLKEIFTDAEVLRSANEYVNTIAYAIGQNVGAITSVAITIGTNILGGIDKYLKDNKNRIKNFIVEMFDIGSEIATIQGNFAQAIANIFSVFGGENGQKATANLIGIFANATMGINQIAARIGRDVLNLFTKPFIDNQAEFKELLESTLGQMEKILGNIKSIVDDTFDEAIKIYDGHIKPMFDSLAKGVSEITKELLKAYNSHIKPTIDKLTNQIKPLVDKHIQPMINKSLKLIGKIADAVKEIWNKVLAPFMKWFIKNIAPVISEKTKIVGDVFRVLLRIISDVVGGILDSLSGLIDFIAGVFTGDWERAWQGIEEYFKGTWNSILGFLTGIWELIKTLIGDSISYIKASISTNLEAIKATFSAVWNYILNLIKKIWDSIKSSIEININAIKFIISTTLEAIKTICSTVWNAIKAITISVWDAIKNSISDAINTAKNIVSSTLATIRSSVQNAWDWIKGNTSSAWESVKSAVSNSIERARSAVSEKVYSIKTSVSNAWDSAKRVTSDVWGGIRSSIYSAIESARSTVASKVESIKNSISNVFSSARDTVSSIFSSIANTISWKMGAAKQAVQNAIDNIRSKFNFSWNLPHLKLPHINITGSWGFNPPRYPHFSVNWYKKGGFPQMGELFVANEAGPEMIGQMGAKNVVANNNQIIQGIANGVSAAIYPLIQAIANGNERSGGVLNVTFELNGQKFARGTIENFEEEARRRGGLKVTLV